MEESAKHASAFAAMPHESEIFQGLYSNPLGKTIHGMIWEKCPSISGNVAVSQSNHIGFGLQNSFREQPFKSERTTKQMGTLIGKARKNKSKNLHSISKMPKNSRSGLWMALRGDTQLMICLLSS